MVVAKGLLPISDRSSISSLLASIGLHWGIRNQLTYKEQNWETYEQQR